jgi:hypothetical protein
MAPDIVLDCFRKYASQNQGAQMTTRRFRIITLIVVPAASSWLNAANAQQCLQLNGPSININFNGLPTTGSNNTANMLPMGFGFVENPGNVTFAADNGSSSLADTYSYGATGSTDRALGELTSGSVVSTIGACFVNNTGATITTFVIGYTGEEWRLGAADATVDRLDFQYSTNATSLTNGTYLNVDALDFVTPNNAVAGVKDGNAAANRTVFPPTAITPAAGIPPGATFYIRWVPSNISGANDGLAIDDFSIGAITSAPACPADDNGDHIVNIDDLLNVINHWGPCL